MWLLKKLVPWRSEYNTWLRELCIQVFTSVLILILQMHVCVFWQQEFGRKADKASRLRRFRYSLCDPASNQQSVAALQPRKEDRVALIPFLRLSPRYATDLSTNCFTDEGFRGRSSLLLYFWFYGRLIHGSWCLSMILLQRIFINARLWLV